MAHGFNSRDGRGKVFPACAAAWARSRMYRCSSPSKRGLMYWLLRAPSPLLPPMARSS